MFALPQRESGSPASCSGTQTLNSEGCEGMDKAQSERPVEPLLELCRQHGPPTTPSAQDSPLSSRGRTIKWFWDSAEEGYRTYHMDEYDEEKNPEVSGTSLPAGTQEKTGVGGRCPPCTRQTTPRLHLPS